MDWESYKQICEDKDVFSRWILTRTHKSLPSDLSDQLRRATARQPIQKPVDHKGDHRTDMFRVRLTLDQQQAIVATLSSAEELTEKHRDTELKPSPILRKWQELIDASSLD